MSSTVIMIRAATAIKINQCKLKPVLCCPAAFHRSAGVSVKKITLNPDVIKCAISILISQTYYLPDKVTHLAQYVIGNPDGLCIGLKTVLCMNHRNKLSRNI